MRPATVVLVHHGSGGSWTWHLVVEELRARGIDTLTPDLPSTDARDNTVGPPEDIQHVRALLEANDGPFVLVGNSYGGWVISAVTEDWPEVTHLVFASAIMPDPVTPMVEQLHASMPTEDFGIEMLPDGRIRFDVESDLRAGFNLAPQSELDYIRPHLGRTWSYGNEPAVLADVAWKRIPSTYVVCTQDRAFDVRAQREWAARATNAIELDSDHAPQHSRPKAFADILERIAREPREPQ